MPDGTARPDCACGLPSGEFELQPGVDSFFRYARERYTILLRQASLAPAVSNETWTLDPILARFRFCNIFREDDRVTTWFREHIRGPLAEERDVLFASICFRWFNRWEPGELLIHNNLLRQWDPELARSEISQLVENGCPITTGAYMIKTPTGLNKLDGLIQCISHAWEWRHTLEHEVACSGQLEYAHATLQRIPFLGSFMSYEVVTDLRHTRLLRGASDIDSWAAMGPGAARGLARVLGRPVVGTFNYHSKHHQEHMLHEARGLLHLSRHARYWPCSWPRWEMREVEHTLCEFDKYERARLGEGRPKQLYRGGPACASSR